MKLIYISNSKLPASFAHGLQIMQMCAAFAKNGCEVELIVPHRVGAIQEDPFDYYGIERIFKITKVPCIDFIYLNNSKFFFMLQLLSFMLVSRLKLLFRKQDILYSRDYMAGLFFKNLALEIHSLPQNTGRLYRYIYKKTRTLVVLTDFIKERLVKLNINGDKILVASDAVNFSKFDISISKEKARKKLGLPLDKKLIGYVGMLRTMGMEKGIDIAIKSLSETRNSPEDIYLVLVGGLPDDVKYYQELALKQGIPDRIIFTGMVRHDLVPVYLKAFDALIAPFPQNEHYSFYMSPLKIFEYMASGRPIISTTLPSLKAILNNTNSVLVSPGSSAELSGAIVKILKDENFSKNIADQALVDVQEYTWIKRTANILFFIKSLLRNKQAEDQNIKSFSSELSVKEYSKKYLRDGERYVIEKYMLPNSLILDVGCGAGRTTYYISEHGCRVIGVDIAAPLIEQARKSFPDINFRVMDVRKLDFQDSSFDTVFFSFNGIDNLASLSERKGAMEEMKRVLKPGGFFIYSSHNGLAIPRTKTGWKIVLNNLGRLSFGPHWRFEEYDFGKLIQYYNNIWSEKNSLLSAGFKNIKIIGNSKKILAAPNFVLAFLDKFPIYITQK